MTVLRRVESFRRSYRQNWGRSGGGIFERYPSQYPTYQQQRIHVFSTSNSGDDVRTVAITTIKVPVVSPHVLEVASSEARQVISKAPAAFMTSASPTSTSSSPQDAMEAAQAVMALTSPTKPLAEAILENKANSQQVFCLHKALVAVTSWCVSLVPRHERLLQSAIDLAHRAQDLSLPLNLPLYRSLVTAIAQYSKDEQDAVLTILEIANLATTALNTLLQASFFSDALLAFVQQGQIQQAIMLKQAIRNRFDVVHLDRQATLKILQALEQHVQQHVDNDNDNDDTRFDPAQVRRLFEMLRPSFHTPKSSVIVMESLADRMAAEIIDEQTLTDALQHLEDFVYEENDEDDSDSDEEDDEPQSSVSNLTEFIFTERQVVDSLEEMLKRVESPNVLDASSQDDAVDEHTTTSQPDHDETNEEREMTKQMVYLRDSTSWMLPDVTLQLVELNGGRDVFYTRQYEQEILKQVIESHATYDY